MRQRYFILLSTLILTLGFQNCGEDVGFTSQSVQPSGDNIGSGDPVAGPGSEGSSGIDDSNPTNTGDGDPNDTTPGTSVTGTVTNDSPVSFDGCDSFTKLNNSGQLINLPAKQGNKCYYIKLLDAVADHSSGTFGESRDSDVFASNHNGNSNSYISPFIMGDASVLFDNSAGWKMSISGAYDDPNETMAIDNFFMIQFQYLNFGQTVEISSGIGTADAEPGRGNMPILYKNLELDFTAKADGGTALVPAIGLEPPQTNDPNFDSVYKLRLRALDCGGSAYLKDVFLVFYDNP